MDTTLIYALFTFAFVSTASPGPNNLMLLASGANFGMRRTLPHILGIAFGIFLMIGIIGLGLAQIFTTYPALEQVLIYASLAYMLWLAWKIAHAAAPKAGDSSSQPFTFLQATAFQWINPKAWVMGVTAQTSFASGDGWAAPFAVSIVFVITCMPSNTLWAWCGLQMQRLLSHPRHLNAFNWSMAALLVASFLPILFH
jgi:threonine/homoserine/homoserine lactone efflux protein